MADGLYEVDALAWGEAQASLLTRLAAGERVNEAIDWSNVIGEIRDVGLSELHACQSLLTQAILHLLKLHASPANPAAVHWRSETAAFLSGVGRRFSPSIRQRIDIDDLYADAAHQLGLSFDDATALRPWPEHCPFTLAELVAKQPDIAGLVAKLS